MPDRHPDQQDILDELASLRAEVTRLSEQRIPQVDRSSRRRDRRLTFAYVLATALAVGLASVGSASALDGSDTVFSDDIVNGVVNGGDIKDGALGSIDIRDGGLLGLDVADGSISTVDVRDGGLSGVDVADGSIGTADVANGSITGDDINLFSDNRCTLEAILGTALINGDPNVPFTYTTAWIGYPHSCSGEQVMVRRVSAGEYVVNFGSQNPARLAQVSQVTSGGATPNIFISVENIDNPNRFLVLMRNKDGAAVDADFSIQVY